MNIQKQLVEYRVYRGSLYNTYNNIELFLFYVNDSAPSDTFLDSLVFPQYQVMVIKNRNGGSPELEHELSSKWFAMDAIAMDYLQNSNKTLTGEGYKLSGSWSTPDNREYPDPVGRNIEV